MGSRTASWTNVVLIFLVPLPSVAFAIFLHSGCTSQEQVSKPWAGPEHWATPVTWRHISCAVGYQYPFVTANVLFFLNVCILFWLISLVQQSTWLIDPYWTLAPLLLAHFYETHPLACANATRSVVSLLLLWAWSLRLTHSYFRRENWEVGAREDWRYADMRRKWGRHWPWGSFLLVYLVQQAMLVGITAAFYPIHSSTASWHPLWDTLATALCATGLLLAGVADNQLHQFMQTNEQRLARGLPPIPLLDTGLWRYSRHPNYFGEQLWWWGLALYAVHLGHPWAVLGTLFNSACMVGVTQLTEARMLAKPERAELFREYQRSTSVWVPWFKSQAKPRRD